jgi:predicted N-formylglutamate amidohydrolase
MKVQVIVTCEHNTHRLPGGFGISIPDDVLLSHQGWDIGAEEAARELANALDAPLFLGDVSRLIVDLNRSIGHPKLFSEFIPNTTKESILERYYLPYRHGVMHLMDQYVLKGCQIVHLSIHSFTPIFNGVIRPVDIGFLYDPKRELEKTFCQKWRKGLPNYVCRSNYPYKGVQDGFVTKLRERYPPNAYLGIELEINQKFPQEEKKEWSAVKSLLSQTALDLL